MSIIQLYQVLFLHFMNTALEFMEFSLSGMFYMRTRIIRSGRRIMSQNSTRVAVTKINLTL